MRCIACGSTDIMAKANQIVPLNVGLDGVALDGITVYECQSCQEAYDEMPPMDLLLDAVVGFIANRVDKGSDGERTSLTGPEIRFLRKRLGLSGSDFADMFEVDTTTVSKWENGKFQMDPFKQKMLLKFAKLGHRIFDDYGPDLDPENHPNGFPRVVVLPEPQPGGTTPTANKKRARG